MSEELQRPLTQATDCLKQSSDALGGLIELVLSQPDDKKITMTRKRLFSLLSSIDEKVQAAKEQVDHVRQSIRSTLQEGRNPAPV